MASSEIREGLKDITECAICQDTFKDPRTLPCIHTFCMQCLENAAIKSNMKPGSNMLCPICRQKFTIPPTGIKDLQKNFFMVKLLEMTTKVVPTSTTRLKCDACCEDNDASSSAAELAKAVKYCRKCVMKLCDSCAKHHEKSKLTKTHELILVDQLSGTEEMAEAFPPEECNIHNKELLKLYCQNCRDVVCAFCFIENHSNHKYFEVEKAAEAFRQQIKMNVENLLKGGCSIHSRKSELDKIKNDSARHLVELERMIVGRKNLLKNVIEEHANFLLADLAAKKKEKLKQVEIEEADLNLHLGHQESYAAYCHEIASKGSPVDICRAEADLKRKADELQNVNKSLTERKLIPFFLKFSITTLDEFLKDNGKNFIGSVTGEVDEKQTLFKT